MLKLKELRLSGVGRFVEEQIINFESLGNLVQIDGQNNNTGGSSGAGKSTIFHALDYLFGLNHIPNTVLKSRLTDNGISVQGTFDLDGKPLIITRGKKLKIDLDGEITTGSSKLAEEKLDEILAIPRDLFRSMLHKRQKEGGFFLKMTPKDINDFLTNCLGLSQFKKKIEIVEDKVKELSEKKIQITNSLESTKSALKATQDAILSLGLGPVKDIHQSVILELKEKATKSSAELSTMQSSHAIEIEALELSRPQISQELYDNSTIVIHESELKKIRENKASLNLQERNRQVKISELIAQAKFDIERYSNEIKAAETAKADAVRVALEIKKIRESICPTCEQGWVNESAKALESSHMDKLESLKKIIAKGASAAQEIVSKTADLNNWNNEKAPRIPDGYAEAENKEKELESLISLEKNKEMAHRNSQNQSNKQLLNEFAIKQRSIREKHSREIEQVRGQADIDRRAFEAAISKLKAYEEARTRHEHSLSSLRAQEASYSNKASELTIMLTQMHNELEMAEELKRAMKSYLSCSFDDALESISDNATKLIRNIPNMANATIQLEGIKTTQDGKIKEEVNAVIHMDGEENVDIRSLCGGERTSTDLAIDLSVIDLIENRANKGIDIFVLDEPFDGLDTVCIEMALEVLKNSSLNKRLIIVDHNPEVKQMVESRLVVVRDGSTSKIVQL